MTESFDTGDMRTFNVAFTDAAGTAADPTAVTFKIREPDGVEVDYVYQTDSELVKDSTGNYHVDYTFSKSGRHIIRFKGAGDITTAEQTEVYIRKSI